jgi:DNA-binding transcriptional ArsR family regulator
MVNKAKGGFQLMGESLEMVAARFRALSSPTRLKILEHLFGGEKTIPELVKETGLSQPNIGKHIGLLSETGVLTRRREGLHVYYGLGDDSLPSLVKDAYNALAKQFAQRSRLFK